MNSRTLSAMTDSDNRRQLRDAQKALSAFEGAYELVVRTAFSLSNRGIAQDLIDSAREVGERLVRTRLEFAVLRFVELGRSTTRLGEEMGISKQRADQLIKQARKAGIEPGPKQQHVAS
jgi:mevalonate kinase